ncbi:TnsD family Tn7-like transposition protein [Guptibacillus hwajinpoensis]|uniref:Uncharacterized protein n=1 Tax=Guptibacillus hwajinpoensis TaxID=208199 RepID=A0A0J6CW90_9BACL|nr:TnsD family Tn7-like transposition protein [Alkalihalobacillus macyae]KMM36354.1 hypothetical protein AB986_18110 [Alkalihalobacillus macyae]
MLVHFPTPYPDELLYSLFARYHKNAGTLSPKQTIKELFGTITNRAVVDLQGNIGTLTQRLKTSKISSQEVIENHTLYPIYRPFIPPDRSNDIIKSMIQNNGGSIHTRTGISASNIKPFNYLRYCPSCCEDDFDKYGETYWHRIHQVPGVLVCPIHSVPIRNSSALIKHANQHEFIIANKITCSNNAERILPLELIKPLFELAKILQWILNNNLRPRSLNFYRTHYIERLKERGLATYSNRIRKKEWYSSFQGRFNAEFLEMIQSEVNIKEDCDWLTMIMQKHRRSFHPVRHALIMLYFSEPAECFFDRPIKHLPFGEGPWRCLNKICTEYNQNVIKNESITYCNETKRPVGTFCCNYCGFIYSRRGPDRQSSDSFKIGRVKEFGFLFDQKLRELTGEGNSLRYIASKLAVDPMTVKRRALMLDLNFSWEGEKKEEALKKECYSFSSVEEQDNLSSYKNKHRTVWTELQLEFADYSKTQLRSLRPDTFIWLYRNDENWLKDNSPKKVRKAPSNKRVDWELRDKEILHQAQYLIKNWDKSNQKPTRRTITSIARLLNKTTMLSTYEDKLPLTMSYLHKEVETLEDFQIKRVQWVIKELKKNNEEVREWKVYRKAGLRKSVAKRVQNAISEAVYIYELDEKEHL